MNNVNRNCFFLVLISSVLLTSCYEEPDEVIQPIVLEDLAIKAGTIRREERQVQVIEFSRTGIHGLSDFGLQIRVAAWEILGDEVEGSNTWVSDNAIVDVSITSDSVLMVTEDSVFAPGEDLTALFKTDRVGRSRFEPRFEVERHLTGKNITFDPIILKLVSGLERPLDQTFLIDLVMDDGQTFSLRSIQTKVEVR